MSALPSLFLSDATLRLVAPPRRVLRHAPTSQFLYYTWGQPHFRKRYLTRDGWNLTTRVIGPPGSFGYYQYRLAINEEAPLMP
jgi:hypothetical protein